MSKQDNRCGCLIVLLIVLFSEALLPIVCAPLLLPLMIVDADPETRRSILIWMSVLVIGVLWFWLKSRSRRKKGDHK